MKNKIISRSLAGLVFVLLGLVSCHFHSDKRLSTLKIYNWGDYIDESVLEDFKVWYKGQTGEELRIVYQVFDINEIMLTKIARGKEDFDLVCPSDYIVERMMKQELLLPIERDFGDCTDYTRRIAPYITHELSKLDCHGHRTSDYAVPYMWGTTGILYNRKFVPEEDVHSWSCLWNPKYRGKILMKDSYRDVYGTCIIYANRERLAQGEVSVDELMNDYSRATIDTVEVYMKAMKPLLAGWEADFGKEMMTKSKLYLNMTWSGDAEWAIQEAEAVGTELAYAIPEEGSTVWYDCWVIPKYAKNVKAASYFINYMCRPDIAIRNMEEIGYVSAVSSPEIMEYVQDSTLSVFSDVSYFFGEAGKSLKVRHTMYPDRRFIEKCAMERDFGHATEAVLDMWSNVKGDNLNPGILAFIFLCFGGLLILGVYGKYKKKRRQRSIRLLKSRRSKR